MQKKTKSKLQFREVLFCLLCLILSFLFIYFFQADLNRTTKRGDKERIATIYYKNNIAQRKFNDRVVWERVATDTPLYDGDTIRTAELAEAVIVFDNGTKLDLYENTMLQIYRSASGDLQIAVDGGGIQMDSTSSDSTVALKLDDGSVVNVGAGSNLSLSSDAESGISLGLQNGSASVSTGSGASATLGLGESVSIALL